MCPTSFLTCSKSCIGIHFYTILLSESLLEMLLTRASVKVGRHEIKIAQQNFNIMFNASAIVTSFLQD